MGMILITTSTHTYWNSRLHTHIGIRVSTDRFGLNVRTRSDPKERNSSTMEFGEERYHHVELPDKIEYDIRGTTETPRLLDYPPLADDRHKRNSPEQAFFAEKSLFSPHIQTRHGMNDPRRNAKCCCSSLHGGFLSCDRRKMDRCSRSFLFLSF